MGQSLKHVILCYMRRKYDSVDVNYHHIFDAAGSILEASIKKGYIFLY